MGKYTNHFSVEDIKARVHKAIGKSSNRTILFSTIIKIVSFILSYANRWGLPSPGIYFNIILYFIYIFTYLIFTLGRHFRRETMEVIFLPAIESYSSLHRKYLMAIQQCE